MNPDTVTCDLLLVGTGNALSGIAISLISLVSGLAQPRGNVAHTDEEAQRESADRTRRRRDRAKAHNMQNVEGAFCWRDGCVKCLSTTKAVQETAEAIALVGDLYDANVSHSTCLGVAHNGERSNSTDYSRNRLERCCLFRKSN